MSSLKAMTRSQSENPDQKSSSSRTSNLAPETLLAMELASLSAASCVAPESPSLSPAAGDCGTCARTAAVWAMPSGSSSQPAPSALRERSAASSSDAASATEGGEASERSAAESRSESDSDGERAVRDELAGAEPCDTMSAPRPITSGERAAASSSTVAAPSVVGSPVNELEPPPPTGPLSRWCLRNMPTHSEWSALRLPREVHR
mmetsp:Transcript_41806/g.135623  ORF Transcript_41806/g.135623 Transcript_41806/m.135623 type:complete len:205 (-) Transcript_41806:110-724(-)